MPDPEGEQAVLHISTAPGDLARLYPWVESAAASVGVPEAARHGVHVALEEAVMNVAMHAYPPGKAGELVLRLRILPDAAAFEVEDAGRPFDPTSVPLPATNLCLAAREKGGLGLVLLRHYCRDISYRRIGNRNRLTLRFPR